MGLSPSLRFDLLYVWPERLAVLSLFVSFFFSPRVWGAGEACLAASPPDLTRFWSENMWLPPSCRCRISYIHMRSHVHETGNPEYQRELHDNCSGTQSRLFGERNA